MIPNTSADANHFFCIFILSGAQKGRTFVTQCKCSDFRLFWSSISRIL